MKVFPITPDQLKQIEAAQAVVADAAKPFQDAQAALKSVVTTITGGAPMMRGWQLTDDKTMIVIV